VAGCPERAGEGAGHGGDGAMLMRHASGQGQGDPDLPGSGWDPGGLLRPYALTGGRVRPAGHSRGVELGPDLDLEVEALVATTTRGKTTLLDATALLVVPERRAIALLCCDLVSIAEVSARLCLPLGVARVLVGDLAEEGLVRLYRPGHAHGHGDDRPDLALLERVLDGLRNL